MRRVSCRAILMISVACVGGSTVSADPWVRPNSRTISVKSGHSLSPESVFADELESNRFRTSDALADGSADEALVFEDDRELTPIVNKLTTVSLECAEEPCVVGTGSVVPNICSGSQTWVIVAPYLWTPAMKGSVTVRGNTQNVDLTLSEMFHLIPDLDGAASGHVEVGKGPTGLIFDGMIMQISPTEPGPQGGSVKVTANLTLLEVLAMRRLIDSDFDRNVFSHVNFDVLGGARYYQVQGKLNLDPVVGPNVINQQSENWVDLVVGARTSVTVVPGLDAFVRGDFAGFGIGTSSDPTWNLVTGIDYACDCCPGSSFLAGYRILDIKESKFSGADAFAFDMNLQGPFIALEYRF